MRNKGCSYCLFSSLYAKNDDIEHICMNYSKVVKDYWGDKYISYILCKEENKNLDCKLFIQEKNHSVEILTNTIKNFNNIKTQMKKKEVTLMANRNGKGPKNKGPNTGKGKGPCKKK